MVFCKEDNRELLLSLKALVQRDRDAGEYVPPSFDNILRSLDEMSAASNNVRNECGAITICSQASYRPGREEFEVLKAYNSLVEAGGRPVCTLGETTNVSENPGQYHAILDPWIEELSTDSALNWRDIFQQQLRSWLSFKAWQKSSRASSDTIYNSKEGTSRNNQTSRLLNLEIHVKAAKQRLSRCGITKTFNFDMNADSQDEWTTWIEYLSFECYCYDLYSQHLGCDGITPLRKVLSLGETAGRKRDSDKQLSLDSPRHRFKLQSMDDDTKGEKRAENSVSEISPLSTRMSKKDVTLIQTKLLPTGDSERDTDTEELMREKHAVDHHKLILWWALLQEPKIAAGAMNTLGTISQHASPLCQGERSRLKRYRDGSPPDSTKLPSCRTLEVESLSGVRPSVTKKRRRKQQGG